jgi:octaprenyl-diphosphate synthase
VLYASVVEFIHTATLVHDDIIDGADQRRGRMAVHSRWGNDITVLLGDYLYIKSMAMALTHDSLEIIRLLCDVTLRMIEGELYQLTKTGDVDISEEEHFEIIRRKTAFLFGGCAQIGGMLGGVTPEQRGGAARVRLQPRRRLPARGRPARLHGRPDRARQADRRRPARGQGDAAGHPAAGPRRPEADRLIRTVVDERAVSPDQWRDILRLLREHRATDSAYERAVEYANQAKACLGVFPPSRERDALAALPDYVLARDR